MKRFLTLCIPCTLFMFHGLSQESTRLISPQQEKTSSISPSGEMTIEAQGFFDPAIAREAGQWNPTITKVHQPMPSQPNGDEENFLKTQEKLEKIRQNPQGWPDTEGVSRNMASAPIVGNEWENLGGGGWSPPDNAGAISGSGYIVSAKNSQIGYYDINGNPAGEWSLADFFSPVYGTDNFVYDPRVEYSNYHNKWVVVALGGASQANSNVLVAFSKTSNPNDGFWMYSFDGDLCDNGDVWFDYPKIAVSTEELYISGNLFNDAGSSQQAVVYQIELADAWTGGTISYNWYCNIENASGGSAFSIVPLGMAWTATTPGITMVSQNSGALTYYYITNSIGNSPSLETFSVSGEGSASSAGNVAQLGSTQLIDGGGTRLRDGFYYDGTIHLVHQVEGNDGFWKIRYTQIDYSTGDATVADNFGLDGYDYNYPSIDPWGATGATWDGSVIIGFLRSATNLYPQFRFVRHDGSWGGSVLLKSGVSPIENNRWGDYIDGAVRENQGQAEVWLFGQFGQGNAYGNWTAQLVESLFGCTDPTACNYDATATDDDGSCTFDECTGCTDPTACNYDADATIDGPCTYPGCTQFGACNYSFMAGCDDGSCCFDNCIRLTMTDLYGDGWNGATYTLTDTNGDVVASGTMADGSEEVVSLPCIEDGCYDFSITEGTFPEEIGWTLEYTPVLILIGADYTIATGGGPDSQSITVGDGGADGGCTDASACNYDASAICENGTCCYSNCLTINMTDTYGDGWNGNIYEIVDLSSEAVVASGTLEDGTNGIATKCLDAGCYEIRINSENGYWLQEVGWNLEGADQTGIEGDVDTVASFSVGGGAGETGCTDPTACNFIADALCDDGSCCYSNCGTLLMFDSYGDGWNGSVLRIVAADGSLAFETTLGTGSEGSASLCLDDGCYTIDVSGNTWPEEVSWLLNMNPSALSVVGGGAPENGIIFELNNSGCFAGCTYLDATNYDNLAAVDDGSCLFEAGCTECAGDFDGNGTINTSDLLTFLSIFGTDCDTP